MSDRHDKQREYGNNPIPPRPQQGGERGNNPIPPKTPANNPIPPKKN